MKNKEALELSLRYLILLLFGAFISVFYTVFRPLTVYPAYLILKLFNPLTYLVSATSISASGITIILIPACIAGAAYYLLLILNLSTPMPLEKRIKSLILSFAVFLIVNIIRIILISQLAISNFAYFDITHKILWYLGSTLLVVIAWFISVLAFKIKSIPACTDIKTLVKTAKK